jgi:hypothetical protein
VLFIAVLCLSGCGSTPRSASGVSGFAHAVSENRTLSWVISDPNARILIKATSGPKAGSVVAETKADAKGAFRVSLAPGSYLVYGRQRTVYGVSVSVSAGRFTPVSVIADTVPE